MSTRLETAWGRCDRSWSRPPPARHLPLKATHWHQACQVKRIKIQAPAGVYHRALRTNRLHRRPLSCCHQPLQLCTPDSCVDNSRTFEFCFRSSRISAALGRSYATYQSFSALAFQTASTRCQVHPVIHSSHHPARS